MTGTGGAFLPITLAKGTDRVIVTGAGILPGVTYLVARDGAISDPKLSAAIGDFLGRLARAQAWSTPNPTDAAAIVKGIYKVDDTVAEKIVTVAPAGYVPIDESIIEAHRAGGRLLRRTGTAEAEGGRGQGVRRSIQRPRRRSDEGLRRLTMSDLLSAGDTRTFAPPASSTSVHAVASDAPPAEGLIQPRASHRRGHGRGVSLVLRALLPLTLFTLWWWGTESGWISDAVLVSPPQVVETFRELVREDDLFHQLSVSLSLALRGALHRGHGRSRSSEQSAGLWRIGEELLDSSMQMLRTIPFLGVVPLFIVWLGIDDRPKVLLISLATLFPMYLNTYNGVRNVDRKVIEAMNVFGLARTEAGGPEW